MQKTAPKPLFYVFLLPPNYTKFVFCIVVYMCQDGNGFYSSSLK